MTLAAVKCAMFFLEDKPGQRVVERSFSILPVYQLKVTPLVFDMAILAVLILRFAVQSSAGLTLCFDPTVTFETVIWHQLVIAAVAFGAVLHTFE